MRAAVAEEGREAVAESRGSVVDGKLGKHEMQIPVILAAVGVGAQSVADHTVSPLHLGIGVLAVRRADYKARNPALDKARNTSLVNLESWSTTSTSGKPSRDCKHMLRMIAAASAAVSSTVQVAP